MHRRECWGFFAAALAILTAVSGCDSVVGVEDADGSESTTASTSSSASTGGSAAPTGVDPMPPAGSTDAEPDPSGGTTTGPDDDATGSCGFLDSCSDTEDISEECDLFEQNCPEGEKCMPWANDGGNAWNSSRCTPLDPAPDGLYEPCTVEGSGVSGIDSCELGMMCWNVDAETLTGTCLGLCIGSPNNPSCTDEGAQCSINGSGTLPVCLPICDPLVEQPCPEGEGCYPSNDQFACIPDASGPKLGGLFESCEFVNGCDAGLMCANPGFVGVCEAGAGGCCTSYCDVSSPECPKPTSCFSFYEKGTAPPGFENVGICGTDES